MDAAITCPTNFLLAERIIRSSFRPRKKMTSAAAKKYWNSGFMYPWMDKSEASKKPPKIPTPPREETGWL
jgi:hypothetical protein